MTEMGEGGKARQNQIKEKKTEKSKKRNNEKGV